MTLEKVIKLMEDEVNNIPVIPHSKLHSAHRLAIEATKLLQRERRHAMTYLIELLPGETAED